MIKNPARIQAAKAEGWLVDVSDDDGYEVDLRLMTHSRPILHKRAAKILHDIGAYFSTQLSASGVDEGAFLISSMTRTTKQQKTLRGFNKSATKGTSAHSYGAAFDVYFLRAEEGKCHIAQKAFKDAMIKFRKQGDIYLVPESDCLHVTVRPN